MFVPPLHTTWLSGRLFEAIVGDQKNEKSPYKRSDHPSRFEVWGYPVVQDPSTTREGVDRSADPVRLIAGTCSSSCTAHDLRNRFVGTFKDCIEYVEVFARKDDSSVDRFPAR